MKEDNGPHEPHYGCPECGSPKFGARQSVTEYCTEIVQCEFTSCSEGCDPAFTVREYADRECLDSEAGEVEEEKWCLQCGREYTEPVFYPEADSLQRVAARSDLREDQVAALEWIIKPLAHAAAITVRLDPHATVILAAPRRILRGSAPGCTWALFACCACGGEMQSPQAPTRHAYRIHPPEEPEPMNGAATRLPWRAQGAAKEMDSRLLPILVRAPLCSRCE